MGRLEQVEEGAEPQSVLADDAPLEPKLSIVRQALAKLHEQWLDELAEFSDGAPEIRAYATLLDESGWTLRFIDARASSPDTDDEEDTAYVLRSALSSAKQHDKTATDKSDNQTYVQVRRRLSAQMQRVLKELSL